MTAMQRINKALASLGLYEGQKEDVTNLFTIRLICLSLFILAQNFWLIYYYNPIRSTISIITLAVSSGIFVVIEFYNYFKYRRSVSFAIKPLLLWLAFALVAVIAELSHGVLRNSLVYLLVLPAIVIIIGSERKNFSLILSAAILGHLPMLLIGVFKYPFINNSYSLVLMCTVALLLTPFWNVLNAKKLNWNRLIYSSSMILLCVVLSWSTSGRTGFLTIGAMLTLVFVLLLLRHKGLPPCLKEYKIFYFVTTLFLILLLLTAFVLGAYIYKFFTESKEYIVKPNIVPNFTIDYSIYSDANILDKMTYVVQNSDPLSGRQIIWGNVIQYPTLLGNPTDFFQTLGLPSYMQTAHNSFLAIFAQLGIPAMLLYIIAYINIVYLAIRYYKKNKQSPMCIFPLIIIFSYTTAGMFEDLSFIVSTRVHALLFYAVAAYLIIDAAEFMGSVRVGFPLRKETKEIKN